MPVDSDKLMSDKRIVAWAAWFVSDDWRLLRFNSEIHSGDSLPTDGLLARKLKFADGTYDGTGPSGWTVFMETSAGPIFQTTGDQNNPDSARYPGAKFIKDKLCPDWMLAVVHAEIEQWR